jgi:hypothetical protein
MSGIEFGMEFGVEFGMEFGVEFGVEFWVELGAGLCLNMEKPASLEPAGREWG